MFDARDCTSAEVDKSVTKHSRATSTAPGVVAMRARAEAQFGRRKRKKTSCVLPPGTPLPFANRDPSEARARLQSARSIDRPATEGFSGFADRV
jgi:hypothetical protein